MDSLENNINAVNKILNHQDFNENSFKKFTTLIKSYNTRYHFRKLLNNFYDILEIKPRPDENYIRKFISLYTIMYYPQVLNIDKSIKTCDNLIKSVTLMDMIFKSILKNYKKLNIKESLTLFHKKFKKYIEHFNLWKRVDIEGLIITLVLNHINLEKDFNQNKEYYEKMLETEEKSEEYVYENISLLNETFIFEKEKIINKIEYLDKKKGYLKFERYHKLLVEDELDKDTIIESVTEVLNENISIDYWSDFQKDIKKDVPDFSKLDEAVLELKHYIYNCIPNKKEIHKHIDGLLDLDFIKSKIINKVFDNRDLEGYFNFILNKLKEYQPPGFDEDTIEFEEELKELFIKNAPLEIVLSSFFSYVTPKFCEIVNLRNEFISLLNKNKN